MDNVCKDASHHVHTVAYPVSDMAGCCHGQGKATAAVVVLVLFMGGVPETFAGSVTTEALTVNGVATISAPNQAGSIKVGASGIVISGIEAQSIEPDGTYAATTGQLNSATTMAIGNYYDANVGVTTALGLVDTQVKTNAEGIATLTSHFAEDGQAKRAVSAVADGDGSVISTTYASKSDIYTKTEVDVLVAQGGTLGVRYDGDTKESITLAGERGTRIRKVASAGQLSATNTNAVNGADVHAAVNRAMTTDLGKQSVVGNVVDTNGDATGDAAFGGGLVFEPTRSRDRGGAVAIGQGASVGSGSGSIAMGRGSTVSGADSIAVGPGHKVSGDNAGAFGDPSTIYASGSYSFGNDNTLGAPGSANTGIFVVGNGNDVTGDNTFVLGSNVKTDASNAVVLGSNSAGVAGAVSVGAPGGGRRIVYVADPVDGTDAANKRYVDAVASDSMKYMDDRLTKKINRLGATSAALSALHPLDFDEDHRLSVAGGVGAYGDEAAGAAGVFYKATDNLMLNVSGAVGTGNVMGNLGIAYRFGDSGPARSMSKAGMVPQVCASQDSGRAVEVRLQSVLSRVDVSQKEIHEARREMKIREDRLLEELRASRQRETMLASKLARLEDRVNRLDDGGSLRK